MTSEKFTGYEQPEKEEKKKIFDRIKNFFKEDFIEGTPVYLALLAFVGPMGSIIYEKNKYNSELEEKEKTRKESLMLPDSPIYPKNMEYDYEPSHTDLSKIRIILPEALADIGVNRVLNNNVVSAAKRWWEVKDTMNVKKRINEDKSVDHYVEYFADDLASTMYSNGNGLTLTPLTEDGEQVADLTLTMSDKYPMPNDYQKMPDIISSSQGDVYPGKINYKAYNSELALKIQHAKNKLAKLNP
jgi:hypothetical protein